MITLVINKKQYEDMFVWFNNNVDNPFEWMDEFIFEKYELYKNIDGDRVWIRVNKKERIVSVSVEHDGMRKFMLRFGVDRTEDENILACNRICEGPLFENLAKDKSTTAKEAAKKLSDFAKYYLATIYIAESYIMSKQKSRKVKYEEIDDVEFKPVSNVKKRKRNKKREDKPIVIDFDDIISGRILRGREHIIRCGKWLVRGHYRHYKSGKIVFIKSFEKGKNRNKGKNLDKTYII